MENSCRFSLAPIELSFTKSTSMASRFFDPRSDKNLRLVFCCPALPVVLSVGRISNTLGIPYAFCASEMT